MLTRRKMMENILKIILLIDENANIVLTIFSSVFGVVGGSCGVYIT